jgi:4-amino-4-deoxy-L-arabinose transferase-like glycosyltransferase
MSGPTSNPSAPSPTAEPIWLSRRAERAVLLAILAVAALARWWRLDLMEFKADEAQACRLAYQVIDALRGDAPLPLTGLMASVTVPNPPLFIYILALPLLVWPNPLAAALFIAGANVAAVAVCYLIGRRYFSPFVALGAAALYALAPWAVIFSRKIWAQDFLPIVIGCFVLAAHSFLIDRQPRSLAWLLILAAAAVQIHFSALILAGVLVVLFVAGRSAVRIRWLGIGLAASLALYAPYFLHFVRTHGADFAHLGGWQNESARLMPAGQRLLLALRYPLSVTGADETAIVVGAQPAWALPFALATGLGAWAGMIWLCVRDGSSPLFSARLMAAIWLVLPTLGLALSGAIPSPHYFIILYPLAFLGLAAALEKLGGQRRAVSIALLAICLLGYAGLDAAIFQTVAERGGAPADYGAAYAHKLAAVDFALAENPDRPFLFSDGSNPRGTLPPEYQFLVDWKTHGHAPVGPSPTRAYLLLDSFRSTLSPAGENATKGLRRSQFGPLTVFVVPLRPSPP